LDLDESAPARRELDESARGQPGKQSRLRAEQVAVAGAAHRPPNSATTMMGTMNTRMKFAGLADSRNGTRVGVGTD
jgi:hypothetical protein